MIEKIKNIKITKQFWFGLVLGVLITFLFIFSVLKYDELVLRPIRSEKYAQQISESKSSVDPVVTATPLPVILKLSEIKWLDEPQRMNKLNVFKSQKEIENLFSESYGGIPDVSQFYFIKVADLTDGSSLINAYISRIGFYGINYISFVVKDDTIRAVLDGVGYYLDDAKQLLSSKITVGNGQIEGLEIPNVIKTDLGDYSNSYPTFEEFNKLNSPQKITDTKYGSLYLTYTQATAPHPLFDRIIYLKLKNGLAVRYSGSNNYKYDNEVQKIVWNDSSQNNIAFAQTPFWGGCSGNSNASVQVIKSSDIDLIQKEIIGKDPLGRPVYKLTQQSPALKLAYEQYSTTHFGNQDETLVSESDFLKDKNNILIQDNFGDWVFGLNPKYAQLAECGKPVIYLYPKSEQYVNIQVGAKITKSDPFYPIKGWNVFAKPNGQLIYQSKKYPYLFWEGLGHGIYPEVKNRGFVVAKDEIEKTLKEHLLKLGLNGNESKDFLEFWLPKMPKTPYSRLTWLMTDDMNKLAPLTVSPKPDTQIRIFLDFEGLDQKISLVPQKLFTPKRNGFTLVEWGGLLVK